MVPVKSMTWSRVLKSAQAVAAHSLLLCFTILLTLKLDRQLKRSWWFIFLPIWLFHIVVARGRFSLPAPSPPHDRHRAFNWGVFPWTFKELHTKTKWLCWLIIHKLKNKSSKNLAWKSQNMKARRTMPTVQRVTINQNLG